MAVTGLPVALRRSFKVFDEHKQSSHQPQHTNIEDGDQDICQYLGQSVDDVGTLPRFM